MKNDSPVLHNLGRLPPVELAAQIERLPAVAARDLFQRLTPSESAGVILEMDPRDAAPLLSTLSTHQIVACLRILPPHVTADLAFAVPVDRRDEVLRGLPPETLEAVTALLRYPPDSAGGAMDNRFIALPAEETVERCLARLRAHPPQRGDDISYLYVIDAAQTSRGCVVPS